MFAAMAFAARALPTGIVDVGTKIKSKARKPSHQVRRAIKLGNRGNSLALHPNGAAPVARRLRQIKRGLVSPIYRAEAA